MTLSGALTLGPPSPRAPGGPAGPEGPFQNKQTGDDKSVRSTC